MHLVYPKVAASAIFNIVPFLPSEDEDDCDIFDKTDFDENDDYTRPKRRTFSKVKSPSNVKSFENIVWNDHRGLEHSLNHLCYLEPRDMPEITESEIRNRLSRTGPYFVTENSHRARYRQYKSGEKIRP